MKRINSNASRFWSFVLCFTAAIHRSSETSSELCNEANFGQTTNFIKFQGSCDNDPLVLDINENVTDLWVVFPTCAESTGIFTNIPPGLFAGSPYNNVKRLILSENSTKGMSIFPVGVLTGYVRVSWSCRL